MSTYMLRRFFQSIAFILVAWLIVYTFLVLFMPGGPRQRYENVQQNGGNDFAAFGYGQRYKLDKPWPLNFLAWLFDPSDTTQFVTDAQARTLVIPKGIDIRLGELRLQGSGILTGDFGFTDSVGIDTSVNDMLRERWGNSFALMLGSISIALVVCLPIGIIGALRQRSRLDHVLTFFSFAGFSMPPFMLGVFLVIFLAVFPYLWHNQFNWTWLPYLPPGYIVDLDQENNTINRLYHLVLPAMTLAIPQIAWLSRHVRSSMLEVLQQDYVRTAWAKGLSARRVILKHALRNALIPLITMVGLAIPSVATGLIIVEKVFSYQGLGDLYFRALGGCIVESQPCPPTGYPIDYPLTLTLTLILVVIVAFSNLLADILYTIVDPRINYSAAPQ
jgi:peptide/nickel transport system permease protein